MCAQHNIISSNKAWKITPSLQLRNKTIVNNQNIINNSKCDITYYPPYSNWEFHRLNIQICTQLQGSIFGISNILEKYKLCRRLSNFCYTILSKLYILAHKQSEQTLIVQLNNHDNSILYILANNLGYRLLQLLSTLTTIYC